MHYIGRRLEPKLRQAARQFPALILSGPRRAGKTTLLKRCFPNASYFLLEDPDLVSRIKNDPRAFIEEVELPAVLDEIQNVPELFNYIRTHIDRFPRRTGQWLLTGSQETSLMRGVTESMAGRAAIFHLLPFSIEETKKVTLTRGGFPEVLARPKAAPVWFSSYIQTYLERDVRAITSIRNLATFRRFLSLTASRAGQMLNRADLAAPLGVSVPTISEWLNILEMTQEIILIPPFYENFGKRLVKSPKIYFSDTGLLCHMLGIDSEAMLVRSPFYGAIYESFVASEIVKKQIHSGKRRELYYFRDRQGLEVDFMIPAPNHGLTIVESKASKTAVPSMVQPLLRFAKSVKNYKLKSFLVYRTSGEAAEIKTIAPGVKAVSLENFIATLFS